MSGQFHDLLVDLVWQKQFNSLGPDRIRFAHRNPDIGIQKVTIFNSFSQIRCNQKFRSCFICNFPTDLLKILCWLTTCRSSCPKVHSKFGSTNRIFSQFFNDALTKSTVFNPFVHSSQNPRGIFNGFLIPDLSSAWSQISYMSTLIKGRSLEGATCSG